MIAKVGPANPFTDEFCPRNTLIIYKELTMKAIIKFHHVSDSCPINKEYRTIKPAAMPNTTPASAEIFTTP